MIEVLATLYAELKKVCTSIRATTITDWLIAYAIRSERDDKIEANIIVLTLPIKSVKYPPIIYAKILTAPCSK
jgi:hypothetical protein